MKFEKNDRYFTIAVYVVGTLLTVVAGAIFLANLNVIWGGLAYILLQIWDLLKPLIIGLIIAYLLDPLITFFAKKCEHHPLCNFRLSNRKKRQPSSKSRARIIGMLLTLLTIIMFVALFVLIITMNIRQVMEEGMMDGFVVGVNNYILYFKLMLEEVNETIYRMQIPFISTDIMQSFYNRMGQFGEELIYKTTNSIKNIGANLVNIVLGLIIALYIALDKKIFINATHICINKLFRPSVSREVYAVGRDIDHVFSGYIRGQLIDAGIMMILTSIALIIIGLDFAIIIGIVAGLFNIIPYFGPVVGFVLAGIIGIIGPTPIKGLYAVIAVIIIQQIDGWYIAPKVVGDNVALHPVVVLISIIIGGKLFGLIGILLAVPVAALIRVLIKRYSTYILNR